MANLKEVRGRIISVKSIQQITKAMKMVSAAKLKRAVDSIVQLRPYANKLKEILENLSSQVEEVESPYTEVRAVKNVLYIPVTSNRGQAGAFNSNVIKATLNRIAADLPESDKKVNRLFMPIGRKGYEFFAKRNHDVLGAHRDVYQNLRFDEVAKITNEVMLGYEQGKWDRVEIVYNQFKNAAVQILTTEVLLPVQRAEPVKSAKGEPVANYIFEPDKEEIVAKLIPEAIRIQLYKAILDSHAAEHGARMTSMDKATENAGELLQSYRLLYNRARQAAITTEILEIVSGASALSAN